MTRLEIKSAAPSLHEAGVGNRAVRDCYVHVPSERASLQDLEGFATARSTNGTSRVDSTAGSVGAQVAGAVDLELDQDRQEGWGIDEETFEQLSGTRVEF